MSLESEKDYANPLQTVTLRAVMTAPSGDSRAVDGFWDGGRSWKIRFAPDVLGAWTFETRCSDAGNAGLHGRTGQFNCEAPAGATRFQRHGPVRVADDHRCLAHADGTPFFWLADTAWNGPLLATDAEWAHYLQTRVRQKFTAVQWVATQYLAAPQGDRQNELACTGTSAIQVNPAFFQRLDQKLDALNQAGLLGVPVMLWAAEWGEPQVMAVNPGLTLPEDQAILLARYMRARWEAYQVAWILNGDGLYHGANASRWQRIGRAVFGHRPHAPVSMHPGGQQWNLAEFRDEAWWDLVGYQSSHSDDPKSLAWLVTGPPATDWTLTPHRPFINLEPCYEYHLSWATRERLDAFAVRRAIYWSLLVAPTAGVTYGGHGVWGWDDGQTTPTAHPLTGVPLPWATALGMPAAEQMQHLHQLFTSMDWWRLRPAPELLDPQPIASDPARANVAARAAAGDLALIYVPADRRVRIKPDPLQSGLSARWFNPRSGVYSAAVEEPAPDSGWFVTPGAGDWVLLFAQRPGLGSAASPLP